jgi:hypothetical protein
MRQACALTCNARPSPALAHAESASPPTTTWECSARSAAHLEARRRAAVQRDELHRRGSAATTRCNTAYNTLQPSLQHVATQLTTRCNPACNTLQPSLQHVATQLTTRCNTACNTVQPSLQHGATQLTTRCNTACNTVQPSLQHGATQLTTRCNPTERHARRSAAARSRPTDRGSRLRPAAADGWTDGWMDRSIARQRAGQHARTADRLAAAGAHARASTDRGPPAGARARAGRTFRSLRAPISDARSCLTTSDTSNILIGSAVACSGFGPHSVGPYGPFGYSTERFRR